MQEKRRNQFVVLIAGMGMLLSTLDTGIMNVALPFLKEQFHTSAGLIAFSVVGYTMSLAIFILPFGVLSDRIGKLKVALWGFLIFGASSIFCGLAGTVFSLIVFRIIQGMGAAALQATSAALITTLVSREYQNKALGVLGVMIGLGPILGPSVGGFLLSMHLWRAIFWINIPFGILGSLCCGRLSVTTAEIKQNNYFDRKGSMVNALMVLLLSFGLFFGGQNMLLLGAALLACGAAAGILLWRMEMKSDIGIIPVAIFKKTPEAFLYFAQTSVFGFATAMIFLLPPFLFENVYGLDAGIIGLLVLGAPLGLMVFSRISGVQNDGSKSSAFSTLGLAILFVSVFSLLFVNTGWPVLLVTALLFVYGVGGGYFQPANTSMVMKLGDRQMQGSIGALQRMVQNIAIAFGTGIGSATINLWEHHLITGIKISLGITSVLILGVLYFSYSNSSSHHWFRSYRR